MIEAEWLACTDTQLMLAFLRGKASERKLRLFACACCRSIWRHIEEDCRRFVEIAELFADGKVDSQTLARCREEAFACMCELTCNSGSVPWLVTVDHPMPEGPPGFRQPATISEAAIETARAAVSAVRDEYFVFHPLPSGADYASLRPEIEAEAGRERDQQSYLLRCIFGPIPFRPLTIDRAWLAWNDGTVVKLAQGIYEERAFDRLPVLADALEEAGCDNADILNHCRQPGEHVRGCWVVDLVLGKD